MTKLQSLMQTYPRIIPYLEHMPEELKSCFTVRIYPAGSIIHQKHLNLQHFGIICDGDTRVINEFENGNVYMIEKNEPVDFIGEVTILAGMQETSVTIEALTSCTAMMFTRKDFEDWISRDIHFLKLVASHVAYKLYRSSFHNGAKLFYPPNFLILDYILKYVNDIGFEKDNIVLIKKTRQDLNEELGITVKTINRTIQKLKEAGVISLSKGKISMSKEQYQKGTNEILYLNKD